MLKTLILIMIMIILSWSPSGLAGANNKSNININETNLKPVLNVLPTKKTVKIDGVLDDEIWNQPALNGTNQEFQTYNPMHGDTLPQKTRVWVSYDSRNLYFAFKCMDTDPEKIKTSVTRRDNQWNDDWVGIALDAMGNGQATYDLFVNPSGVQGDIYMTLNNGEDSSPDWVWESAGRVTEDGYVVEIKLPLKSIRYKSGKSVDMGILFWRRISRLGVSGAWPALVSGESRFKVMATMNLKNLESSRNIEILPSITHGSTRQRVSASKWGAMDKNTDAGISIKYGFTSAMTGELTVNPDFSQVESDSFQVNVNRRYPIFYSEKRPFFMESQGLFNIAGTGGDYNMSTAVHTRRIVDPSWGARFTGTVGKTTFGVLASQDRFPGQAWEDETNPNEGKSAFFSIARAKHNFGSNSYVGVLFSRRDFAGTHNQVIGGDSKIRLARSHTMEMTFMNSRTWESDSIGNDSRSGNMMVLSYEHFTNKLGIMAFVEHYGKNFQLDTGFYNRTGITSGTFYFGPQFVPSSKKLSWIKRINPFFFGFYLHDTITDMDDMLALFAIRFSFTRQGWFRTDFRFHNESWVDQTFKKKGIRVQGGLQLYKWINIEGNVSYMDSIYYDAEEPFLGKNLSMGGGVTIQPNSKFRQGIYLDYVDFRDPDTDKRVYDAFILNSSTTYQFNKYFFLRGIVRYDNYQENLLTDFLASFTLIPGTVVHVGYGALYEKDYQGIDLSRTDPSKFIQTRQSFFFKASYLWRF
jgi:hypothetical protein